LFHSENGSTKAALPEHSDWQSIAPKNKERNSSEMGGWQAAKVAFG
jgi:hypothetical protein